MKLFQDSIKNNKQVIIVTLVMGFLWSWLFLVDVTNLAKSLFLGFALMMVAYAIMVAISSYAILKTWPYIAKLLKKPSWQSIIWMLLIWAAVELVLSWVLNLVWMGREGSWSSVIPFVSLTPMIAVSPLRFLTRLFGYFGASAVIGVGVMLVIVSVRNVKWRKPTALYWTIVIVLNVLLWIGFTATTGPVLTATMASEHLSEPQLIDPKNSELVIVPEYGLDDYTSEDLSTRFSNNNREVFITGTKQYGENNGNSNVLVYGSNKQGYIYEHKKSRLIVGGEYLPMSYELFVRTFSPDLYSDFTVRRAIQKGTSQPEPFMLPSGVVIGNAACSSIIQPDDYRALANQGANVLANSASLEVFRGSRVFALHHDGLAKFMATANARPFLQSANDWKAFAIDHNGNTLKTVAPVGQVEVTIQTNARRTPYSYLGEWLAYVGIAAILIALLKKRYLTKTHQ